MFGHDLSGSKINSKRNNLRLYESLLRHGCQKAFLHAICAMRYMNLSEHSYKMKMSKNALFDPCNEKLIKTMEIKWSKRM